ncbi:MAG: hypothetical protein KBT48_11975 [Firmicutes bacterium]|nr:hypothetical protein [Bacillota bacterium]
MDRLKAWYQEEKEKIQGITGLKRKLEYIWQYYYLWIVGVIGVICFLSFTFYQYNHAITDYWFYITFANTNAEIGNGSELWQGYIDYTGFDTKEKNVEFNNVAYFDYRKNETGNTYFESYITYTDAGTLDAVTMESESLELLGQSGRLLDLNRDECKKIKEKYEDKFIYALPFDVEYSGEPVPIGIDISDSILMEKYNIYPDSCAIGIGANTKNIDAVIAFLEYIYGG